VTPDVAPLPTLDRLADVGLGCLGPGAGHDGGRVVFAGMPAGMVARGDSLTARHLRAYLGEEPREPS
jgi:excinuclease UvrABC ATPase subunit